MTPITYKQPSAFPANRLSQAVAPALTARPAPAARTATTPHKANVSAVPSSLTVSGAQAKTPAFSAFPITFPIMEDARCVSSSSPSASPANQIESAVPALRSTSLMIILNVPPALSSPTASHANQVGNAQTATLGTGWMDYPSALTAHNC